MIAYTAYDVTSRGLEFAFKAETEGEAIERGRFYCTGTMAIYCDINECPYMVAIMDRLAFNAATDCIRIEWVGTGLIETQIPNLTGRGANGKMEWLTLKEGSPLVQDSIAGQRYKVVD